MTRSSRMRPKRRRRRPAITRARLSGWCRYGACSACSEHARIVSTLDEADRAHLETRYAEAVELYRLALAGDPDLFEARYGLASACASRLEYGDAIAGYRSALAQRPHDAILRVNLASALFALGYVT